MSEGKRPGGLTALAVINFIFAALGLLGIISMIALAVIFQTAEVSDEATAEIKKAFEEAGISLGFFIFIMVIQVVVTILLFLSGLGYLKQKKFLGRTLGNTYALIAIASSLLTALVLPLKGGGGFNLNCIINLIYPVLTLFLLNTTFKEDFTE